MTYSAMLSAITEVPARTWVALSFLPIAALFILALWRADQGEASAFKFIHFVTNDVGRGSYYALGYTVLVAVCTWGVWALIALDQLTEWYMTLIISGFILGALGGTAARVVGKVKGAPDVQPDAGDDPGEQRPAMERTIVRTEETVRATRNAPAADGEPLAVRIIDDEPVRVREAPPAGKPRKGKP